MNDRPKQEDATLDGLKETTLDDLVRRYSSNEIPIEDFERRATGITKASTRTEVLTIVADLPEARNLPAQALKRALSAGASGWRLAPGAVRDHDTAICIFGGSDRKGVWAAPRDFTALCVFGGANLDLRKAVIPPEGMTIRCFAAFGGVDLVVPPDIRLEVRGAGIFGGFEHKDTPDAPLDAPLIVIEGFAVFGGVGIKVRH